MSSRSKSALSALGRRSDAPPITWLMILALSRPKLISLAAGFTDQETLPNTETLSLLTDILGDSKRGKAALQYGTTQGDPVLRELTSLRLLQQDQAASVGWTASDFKSGRGRAKASETQLDVSAYAPERMILTHGSQQLLYLTCEALCDEGDIVLVEDPTYFVFLGIAQSRAIDCRGVKLDPDGLDLDSLEAQLERLKKSGDIKKLKFLYLVSYYQNPSSVTTSRAKKAAALKLLRRYERAAGHPIYLLEDAAYRELRFEGDDVPSLLAEPGAAERVIYAGTYSKPFATGIRVGFGLMPEALQTVCLRLKGNHDFGTANLLQQIVARSIQTGIYAKHVAMLRKRYADKAAVMLHALEEHLPSSCSWLKPSGGLYVWTALPKHAKAGQKGKFFQAALDAEVLYVPGEVCYAEDKSRPRPANEMRLTFGGASEEAIREGVRRLGKAVGKFYGKT